MADPSLSHQAEAAWARREEPGQTRQAIEFWKKALREDPAQSRRLIPLTLACGRAYRHAAEKSERVHWADEARRYGAEAAAKNPHDAWAYAVYGEALGQWAEAHKGVRALKAVKLAVRTLEKAVALDPRHYYAHMLLSQFYGQAPRAFSVGNRPKGLEEARLAVRYGPPYAITHLALARNLRKAGRREEAVEEFKKVLALPPPADAIPETRANQEDAREELRAMGVTPSAVSAGDQASCEAQGKHWEQTPAEGGSSCHE